MGASAAPPYAGKRMQTSAYRQRRGGRPGFDRRANLFRTLAHPGRLEILACLRRGPACVCHLTVALRRPQAYLSQQLAVLRRSGLIEAQRDGMFVFYRLTDRFVTGVLARAAAVVKMEADEPTRRRAPLRTCACPACRPMQGRRTGARR